MTLAAAAPAVHGAGKLLVVSGTGDIEHHGREGIAEAPRRTPLLRSSQA